MSINPIHITNTCLDLNECPQLIDTIKDPDNYSGISVTSTLLQLAPTIIMN